MATDRDHQDDERNTEENRVRDKEQQHQDKQSSEHQENQKITGNPERLRDNDHQMDKNINDVQGDVDYGQERPNEFDHQLERSWTDIKSDYRKRYPNLTEEDLHYKSGEFKVMTDRIAKRTNRTSQEVTKEIMDWDKGHHNS